MITLAFLPLLLGLLMIGIAVVGGSGPMISALMLLSTLVFFLGLMASGIPDQDPLPPPEPTPQLLERPAPLHADMVGV
ncbi:MAG: hypothetical protein AAFR79_02710 [Pseudomonadota bacterium]